MSNIKPILFTTDMVRAIKAGSKSQTRRQMDKDIVPYWPQEEMVGQAPHQPGTVLWVRETFRKYYSPLVKNVLTEVTDYKADNPPDVVQIDDAGEVVLTKTGQSKTVPWKPSLFMPKDVARIFLEVTRVRAERLTDISEIDSIAEGIRTFKGDGITWLDYLNEWGYYESPVDSYLSLFKKITGLEDLKDVWVWVYDFKPCDRPPGF